MVACVGVYAAFITRLKADLLAAIVTVVIIGVSTTSRSAVVLAGVLTALAAADFAVAVSCSRCHDRMKSDDDGQSLDYGFCACSTPLRQRRHRRPRFSSPCSRPHPWPCEVAATHYPLAQLGTICAGCRHRSIPQRSCRFRSGGYGTRLTAFIASRHTIRKVPFRASFINEDVA